MPSAVFASTAEGYRLPTFYVWRTLDGGDTWQRVSLLAPEYITAFTFDSQRGTSYAASSKFTASSSLPRLWKSTDYFQSSRAELRLPGELDQVRAMYVFQGLLLLVGVNPPPYPRGKIWVTDNEGVSWFPLTENLDSYADTLTIAVMSTTPPKLVAGTDSGLYIRDLPTIQHTYAPWVVRSWAGGW